MKPFTLFSHAVRAKEIVGVLARHGFADLLDQFDLPPGLRQRLVSRPYPGRTAWERIRLTLEELGPAFVKCGQLMSMRPDALPAPLILELRKLQNEVRPVPFAEIRPVAPRRAARRPRGDLQRIRRDPRRLRLPGPGLLRAAAGRRPARWRSRSSARTSPARSRSTSTSPPGSSASCTSAWPILQPYDLPAVFAEVRQGVHRELDFGNEARNQQYFNTLNPDPAHVFAPAVVTGVHDGPADRDGTDRRRTGRTGGAAAGAGPRARRRREPVRSSTRS